MSHVGGENFDGVNVETRERDRHKHLSDDKVNRLLHVARCEFRQNAKDSAANHSDEKCFLAAQLVHHEICDKVAWKLDETDDLGKNIVSFQQSYYLGRNKSTHNEANIFVPILQIHRVDVQAIINENRREPKICNV